MPLSQILSTRLCCFLHYREDISKQRTLRAFYSDVVRLQVLFSSKDVHCQYSKILFWMHSFRISRGSFSTAVQAWNRARLVSAFLTRDIATIRHISIITVAALLPWKLCYAKHCLHIVCQCFFPREVVKDIRTPVFILNPAYDAWQVWSSVPWEIFYYCVELSVFNVVRFVSGTTCVGTRSIGSPTFMARL